LFDDFVLFSVENGKNSIENRKMICFFETAVLYYMRLKRKSVKISKN